MLHIHLKGRLGNNLFQIAAGASLAKANNAPAAFQQKPKVIYTNSVINVPF